jgi:hypothetical protein
VLVVILIRPHWNARPASGAGVVPNASTVARAIYTCTLWWSDTGISVSLLSLGTTYKLHTEAHRQQCLSCLTAEMAYCQNHPDAEMRREFRHLSFLRDLVKAAAVGVAWISYAENDRRIEQLYQQGRLARR